MTEVGRSDGTVGKALAVLDEVAAFGRPVRFSEVLAGSPLPKATLFRLIQSLTNQGMLTYDDMSRTYRPGLRLVRFAHAAWAQSSLAPVARPWLDRLARQSGLTVHLAQLDGGHVLYVDKRNAAQSVEMFSQAGKIGPAYCTGVGKAMLAWLEADALEDALSRQAFRRFTPATLTSRAALAAELAEVRARGLAFDREEHEVGIICVAAPILGAGGRPLGALSITSTVERHRLSELAEHGPEVRAIAAAIAIEAEAWRFPTPAPSATQTEQRPCPV